ncbi:unnamed protein product [Prorocentrum cordatum]|uniref:Uncharacterized protein n=1 Tax=Prorocentrum cordatum TaxID=2364126 RepID=A0ABN9QIV8_9DINO|nr:unnamed protein product [Polarella glacialis]
MNVPSTPGPCAGAATPLAAAAPGTPRPLVAAPSTPAPGAAAFSAAAAPGTPGMLPGGEALLSWLSGAMLSQALAMASHTPATPGPFAPQAQLCPQGPWHPQAEQLATPQLLRRWVRRQSRRDANVVGGLGSRVRRDDGGAAATVGKACEQQWTRVLLQRGHHDDLLGEAGHLSFQANSLTGDALTKISEAHPRPLRLARLGSAPSHCSRRPPFPLPSLWAPCVAPASSVPPPCCSAPLQSQFQQTCACALVSGTFACALVGLGQEAPPAVADNSVLLLYILAAVFDLL